MFFYLNAEMLDLSSASASFHVLLLHTSAGIAGASFLQASCFIFLLPVSDVEAPALIIERVMRVASS